jgi:hypothetical protein
MQDDVSNGGMNRDIFLFLAGMGAGGFSVALLYAIAKSAGL